MTRTRARAALLATLFIAAMTVPATTSSAAVANPAVHHIFVIVLENEDAQVTFGNGSPAPYLSKTLTAQGQLLDQYYGIGHESLDNYIAMVSGQAPNPVTQADCQLFTDWFPATPLLVDANGQAVGQGCVMPTGIKSVGDQLDAAGASWKGYMEDMSTPCRHPAINAQDETQKAKVGDQYASRHDPFMYFHSIIDNDAACQQHVVDLAALPADLGDASTTPNLSFITPNLCHDGHDAPCVDGQPGGLVSADLFLQQWVPQILDSPAFKDDGMLVVTFDEGEFGNPASASACCGETPGPNSPLPGIDGPGGGRIGAVVISQFTQPGSVNETPYNHYSLLRTIEDQFGLAHLGFAAASGLKPFGADVFNATSGLGASGSNGSSGTSTLAATGRGTPYAAIALAAVAILGFGLIRRRRA